jgi:hypothetical protein
VKIIVQRKKEYLQEDEVFCSVMYVTGHRIIMVILIILFAHLLSDKIASPVLAVSF